MLHHNQKIGATGATTLAIALLSLSAPKPALAVDACTQTTALSGGSQTCGSSGSNSTGSSGTAGGFTWTLWANLQNGGTGCMTPYGKGAAFTATWTNPNDFLAREGFQWDETKSYDQYGTVYADYSYKRTGSAGGYSFIGIYGWSNNPLVEYYIVDDWFGSGSPPTGGGTMKGSFTMDGATYNIYQHTQNNQPSIHGTATFPQFFSVRQTPRQCGHISISEHWKKWNSLQMTLGKMYEAKLLLEAGGGTGSITYTYGDMQANAPATSLEPASEPVPQLSQSGVTSWVNGKPGVLSLVSLNGSVIRSVRQDASNPAIVPTANLAKGVYVLRFQGEGSAPETRKFLLD